MLNSILQNRASPWCIRNTARFGSWGPGTIAFRKGLSSISRALSPASSRNSTSPATLIILSWLSEEKQTSTRGFFRSCWQTLTVRSGYRRQRDLMVKMIEESFPAGVDGTRLETGMFLWVTLPENMSSLELFDRAIKNDVDFVPGQAFYANGGGYNTLRLNFSNSDEERIVEGMGRLPRSIEEMM